MFTSDNFSAISPKTAHSNKPKIREKKRCLFCHIIKFTIIINKTTAISAVGTLPNLYRFTKPKCPRKKMKMMKRVVETTNLDFDIEMLSSK